MTGATEIETARSPRVSVIIATYNRSGTLRYAIASVLGQTMQDFELLVVGDGCTDDSEAVVTAYNDPRIRWINLPENSGHQSAPNNRGLQEARGEFIAYLGHDDLWLKHHLEFSVQSLDQSGAAFAHSLMLRIANSDGDLEVPIFPDPGNGIFAPPSCTIHRRTVVERIGGWNDYRKLTIFPDVDFCARARAAGFETVFVPRLTVIKFPATRRKDVYKLRPSNEQADWYERIQSTPDFETAQLVAMLKALTAKVPSEMPIRMLLNSFMLEFGRRVRGRISRLFPRRGKHIDRIKRFKGL
jgi:GT2 family glycosyltransferase